MRYDARSENGWLLAAVRQVIDRKSGSPSKGTFSRARVGFGGRPRGGQLGLDVPHDRFLDWLARLDAHRDAAFGQADECAQDETAGLGEECQAVLVSFRASGQPAHRFEIKNRPPPCPWWLSVRRAFRAPCGLDTEKVVARFAGGRTFRRVTAAGGRQG